MKTKLKSILAAAFCAVGLAAFAEPGAVQPWEGGPYFATCNVGATEIAAESDEFTVDLRTDVALAKGEVTIPGVTWSATAWDAVPETFTTVGYTNLTTGATGVFGNLSNIMGEGAKDANLPKADGDYVLTHSTGDLKSFVTFVVSGYPLGSEGNPWTVGPSDNPDGTVAWTDGNGNVYFQPPRSAVSRTGLETITNAMGGAGFPAWLVSADGAETNGLAMVVGGSGACYDSLGDALASDDDSYALYDVEGCVVNYDGRGAAGEMASDTFLPGVPTNLTANAYKAFGWEFQGWTTNGDTEVVFADEAAIDDPQAGDVYDLKAVWKLVPVPVGNGVTAYLDGEGTLHIEGEGEMKDFTAADSAPWAEFAPDIKTIEVAGGVTKVGNAAFAVCPAVEGASVVFRNPQAVINLGAFVSGDGTVTNVPAVKVETVTGDGRTLRVVPGGWTDADDPGAFYATVAEALEGGVRAVVAAFTRPADEGGAVIPPAEIEEAVKAVPDPSDPAKTVELVAKVVNDAGGQADPVGLVTDVEGLDGLVDALNSNVTVTVTATDKACVPSATVKKTDGAMSDLCERTLAEMAPGVGIVGFESSYFDLATDWSFEDDGGPLSESGTPVVLHIPAEVYDGMVYSVARDGGDGTPETLPFRTDVDDDGTAEWFWVDTANGELVVKTRKFGLFALGELEPETSCTVVVGDCSKALGEPDPASIATNFAIRVTGRANASGFAGYAKRTPGEAAGEYAIGYVSVGRLPDGFPSGAYAVRPGTFTITAGRRVAGGAVTGPKLADDGVHVKAGSASWKAVADGGSVFAGWELAEGASADATNAFKTAKATDKPALSLKIDKDAKVLPDEVVAVYRRLDDGLPDASGRFAVMVMGDLAKGTTKGSGVYTLKKGSAKVSLNAKPAKDYVFAGWYLDPGFTKPAGFVKGKNPSDYRNASQSVVLTKAENVYYFARFVEKTTKRDPISHLRFLGAGYCGADASERAAAETWYQGVALPADGCEVAFGSLSLPKVAVKGLPSGVKFDKATNRLTGVPSKAGVFTLQVTVKNASGATDVLTRTVTVKALPAWAVGNFDGYHIEKGATNGTFTATVGKGGKVSGKTAGGAADTTFSAKSFSNVFTLDGSNLIYAVDVDVKVKGRRDPTTDTLYLMEDVRTGLGTIGGGDTDGCGCVGVQRAWDRKDLAFPDFDAAALKDPIPVGDDGLALKFGAKGKVTVGGTVGGAKASGSASVMPFAWTDEGRTNLVSQTCVHVPKAGFCAVYDVLLTVGAGGKFDTASVMKETEDRE